MTPNQVTNAYKAILRLSETVFPYKTARSAARLKNRLAEEVDTIAAAEKTIVEKYGGTISKNGTISIDDQEHADKCADALNEFRAQDDDIELPVVDLSKYADSIRISPADVDALEGIVLFEKETGEDDC